MLLDSGRDSTGQMCAPKRTDGEVPIRAAIGKRARTRCVFVGVTTNETTRRTRMRVSRKDVTSATHAVPEVRFEEQELTSFGGLVMLQALLHETGLRARLRSAVRHLSSSTGYCASRIVMLLIVHLFIGWRRLRDLDYYSTDPLVKRVVGLDRIPNVSTVSRRLTEFDELSIDNLRGLLREIVAERAIAASPQRLTLDFDGSVISTKARGIEGTAIGYNSKSKGSRSYYPLFAVMAQTGQIFDVLHRAGNCHDSRGALDLIVACEQNLRSQGFRGILEARLDGAHYSDATCIGLHDARIEFSVSVPFERLPQLKGIIEERVLWHRIDDEWSYFKWSWRPNAKSRRSFPCVIYRRRVAKARKGPIQLDLFEPVERDYEYKVVMTNKRLSPAALLHYHNGRGSQEATLGEGKSQLALGYLPSRRQVGNQVYLLCNLIAHALGRELQMRAAPPRSTNTATRACLWAVERIGTLRNRLIKRAARLIRPQGRPVLSFANCPDAEHDIRNLIHAASAAA